MIQRKTLPAGPCRALIAAAVLACGTLSSGMAGATTLEDPQGDILETFRLSNDGLDHSDLDVVSVTARRDDLNFYLSATMAGDIGLTEGGIYIWGVNRGSGIALLNQIANPIGGPNIKFDTFIQINQDGTAALTRMNTRGPALEFLPPVPLVASLSGRTVRLTLKLSDLPSEGFAAKDYEFNLWPRFPDVNGNENVADFAPDGENFTASVPEPASWALLIAGFGLSGSMLRRRRVAMA